MAKQIPLTQGKFSLVDDADFEFINQWKWQYHTGGYARRDYAVDGKRFKVYMHRVITGNDESLVVDHINGDRLDNRKENLRLCHQKQNSANSRKSKNNTTGFKGVCFYKRDGVYTAQLMKDRKMIYLGRFTKPEYAAAAYDLAAMNLFGDFANTNFNWEKLKCRV